jgi:hypothetical protein
MRKKFPKATSGCLGPGRTAASSRRSSTVLIEPDRERLILVWQTSLRVAARDGENLDDTVIEEAPAA